ncbi:NAD-dependent epimerase/dehydratase family protein [Phyllobacterium phragmitis]|uniref:NAD-dependent epimerase/dehydratase family protein n=1 Tax=Phyllobacterium phragmitis TaxID=2670329 RepID=UPI001304B52B|nr:NAD-dependent epimerase/dehydratase family protein [Phyllobacterium phragmitis]
MKALIVGGTRFIGAHVARRLHDTGTEITIFHRGTNNSPILPEVEHVLDPGAEYPITSLPARLLREWDVVVHSLHPCRMLK